MEERNYEIENENMEVETVNQEVENYTHDNDNEVENYEYVTDNSVTNYYEEENEEEPEKKSKKGLGIGIGVIAMGIAGFVAYKKVIKKKLMDHYVKEYMSAEVIDDTEDDNVIEADFKEEKKEK